MKRKTGLFISLITATLSLCSCSFVNILSNKVQKLVISDAHNAYLVGDTFATTSSLEIVASYIDKTTKKLPLSEVTASLTLGSTSYDVNQPFTVAGDYSFKVAKDGIISNKLTIKVFASTQYVESMEVSGAHSIGKGSSTTLSLTVSPEYYTVPISYSITSGEEFISVIKNGDTNYIVRGNEIGDATITFKAPHSETPEDYTEVSFDISVSESEKVEIQQTYNDYIKNNYYTLSSCPLKGDVKLLVIPVWFTDSSSYIDYDKRENVREDINTVYFGSSTETGWNSVSSYYYQESNYTLNLTGTVSEWYSCGLNSTEVSKYKAEDGPEQNTLVKNAVSWYFANNPEDSSTNYDYDGDGYVDGVMLIYAAPDDQVISYGSGENMWAYCFFVQDSGLKDLDNPGPNVYFWASYDFMYGSLMVYARTGTNYSNGNTSHCNLDAHTYIHEMGHVFGLEDYYDYASATSPAAGFSMQDHNVGGHDPFSVMSFGWADPYIPTESTTLVINDFQSSHDLILLSPSWNSKDSVFDEYILLELYSNTGLNNFDSTYTYRSGYAQGPNAVGLRVWHVDARLLKASRTSATFITDSNVKTGNVLTAFNNTSNAEKRSSEAYRYFKNADYQRFSLLSLVRNSTIKTYEDNTYLTSSDLFKTGSSFSLVKFSRQFVKNTVLNGGSSLGWSFTVQSITDNLNGTYSASIELVKE